jgi:twitching motility protein PilJ
MEESTREVVEGSKLAQQAGQTLNEIDNVSNRLAELIQTISSATKDQARGAEALTKSMNEINAVTQQTASGTKQAATSVSKLAKLADALRVSVANFKLPSHSSHAENSTLFRRLQSAGV